ncbi:MAG: glycoside hydrolase family 13 protein [Actinobacteria bacterium]|uniref:Unannotated protein n=1 Tax=freshwater metagenome TaxID=449393 RepID=A0A6J6PUX0_9ZZZZ|nr:glycoside hydrolase family 13 protein [Actinomycetota bacterium]MTA67235.1 glycoside hydrolase family 13 protein [Actinomycetota bacterium]
MNSAMQPFRYPHHDGSELYVSNSSPEVGEKITLKFRTPDDFPIDQAMLRIYHDGEPRYFPMKKSASANGESWWSVKAEVMNKKTSYRFLMLDGVTYRWLNGSGVHTYDVTSAQDFQLLATPANPSWIRSSVFYQIFPDRFATSEKYKSLMPKTFVAREWNDIPHGRDKSTGHEFFGGDLDGVRSNLSHLEDLGINGIYFTPYFPASSTHRYDASSFDHVDPLLGGDKAMIALAGAAKKAGIAMMGDLTTNHCGAGHPWIKKALTDKKSKERAFFYWDKSIKHGYEGWWGLASLPKLNFSSEKLQALLYSGKRSIVKKWLLPPFSMSGWRIDVGNMTGVYKGENLNAMVVQGIRDAMDETNPNAWLVAENADNFPADLDGFGWHGTMNYNGFMRPIWGWLQHNADVKFGFFGLPTAIPTFSGKDMATAMSAFNAGIPWRSLVSSMLLLDSHDTARFRNVVGHDVAHHIAGMGILLTYPGVPSIFAGDEVGLQGAWGEDARRTINWDDKDTWDTDFLAEVKKLIAIRRKSHALSDGGLQWVVTENNYVAYIRESKKEKLLVVVTRTSAQIDLGAILTKAKTLYGPITSGTKINFASAGVGIYKLS